jgi:hypothetical protein
MSRSEIESAFGSEDGEKISAALISSVYTESGPRILDWCLKFIEHPNGVVRYCAVQVLGIIAIIHWNEIDLGKCREAIEKTCGDPDQEVRIAAQDALEDVQNAMKLREAS